MVVTFINPVGNTQQLLYILHAIQIKQFILLYFLKLKKLHHIVVRSNSIFNFFNQVTGTYMELTSLICLQKTQSQNSSLWLVVPIWCKVDLLNNSYAAYREIYKLNRLIIFSFLSNYFLAQWAHLAFRGKSFRVRNFSSRNKLTLNFGYSHWTRLKLNKKWAFFKRRRQCYVMYTWCVSDFYSFIRFFPYIRFYNKYTMRGLRLRKQPIIRRFGKISQHISILH